MKKFLTRKVKGFSGITHMLIATLLFQIVWILPFFNKYTSEIKDKGIIAIIIFWGIVIGSSIIPDLDNEVSTAGHQLGILGQVMSMFMILISSVVTSILKTKNDHWKSQHRLFWHAPFVYIVQFLLIMFLHPTYNETIVQRFKNGNINISETSIVIVFLLLSICSFYLFMNSVCYNGSKLITSLSKVFSLIKIFATLGVGVFLVMKAPISYLKLMAYAVCIGSLFHNIGDFFSLGSIPIFFPIPVKKQMWLRPHTPFQLETGGVMNKVLNFVLAIIVAIMFLIIFGFLTFK